MSTYATSHGSTAITVARADLINSTAWRNDQTTWGDVLKVLFAVYEHDEETIKYARQLQGQEKTRDALKHATPVIFPGQLIGTERAAGQIVSRTLLVGDVDGAHTRDEIHAKMKGTEHVVYETVSSQATVTVVRRDEYLRFARSDERMGENYLTSTLVHFLHVTKGYPHEALEGQDGDGWETFDFGLDHMGRPRKEMEVEHAPMPRFRIVVPMAKPFVVAEHAEAAGFWKRLTLAFFDSRGIRVDECCAELNRAYWVPATTWTGDKPLVEHQQGELLDIEALAEALPEIERTANPWWRKKDRQQDNRQQSRQQGDQKTRQQKGRAGGHPRGLPNDYEEVLSFIKDVESRTVWRMVGMAIHHATGGSELGFEAWHNWARQSSKNDPCDDRKAWDHFRSDRERVITWGSVEDMAAGEGFVRAKDSIDWPEANKLGVPATKSIANIKTALNHLEVGLWYNTFSARHHVEGAWYDEFVRRHRIKEELGCLTDLVLRAFWDEMHQLGLVVDYDWMVRAVITFAEKDMRHPLRDYLDWVHATWDGKPRLDRVLVDYCGAEDTPFNRAAGSNWMKAAVRRVRQPGCKFDQMLVLESKEGEGKSTFGSILAGDELFSDCLPIDAEPKVVIEQTRGFWLIEFAELKGIKERAVENVKAFLSRKVDSARGAYGKMRSDVPRQWISFGSTNDTTYLMGSTGNRRFWPVAVGKIDLEALRQDRDQLWAEAAVREAAGESIQLPEELWSVAAELQEQRRVKTPMEQQLIDLLEGHQGVYPVKEIYRALGFKDDMSRVSATHGQLIKRVLEKLGFEEERKRIFGKKTTVYRRGMLKYVCSWDYHGNTWVLATQSPRPRMPEDDVSSDQAGMVN